MPRRPTSRARSLLTALSLAAGAAACNGSGAPADAARDAPASDADRPPRADAQASDVTAPTDATTSDAPATDGALDAASPDGAPADAGRSLSTDRADFGLGGPSRCATAGVQLCEDFETGALDTATWHVNGTAPTIDGVHTARGSHALHIVQHGNGASYLTETRTFPAVHNTYWGRIFVYFQSLPQPAMGYAHWTFAAASGSQIPGEIRLSGQLSSGVNRFGVGTDSQGYTGDWTSSDNDAAGHPIPVPTGQWLCIEWLHDGQANETRFFWDAVEHTILHTTATMHGFGSGGDAGVPFDLPQFERLWVGWQEYQTSTETFELWVDEIAVDSARIGCVL